MQPRVFYFPQHVLTQTSVSKLSFWSVLVSYQSVLENVVLLFISQVVPSFTLSCLFPKHCLHSLPLFVWCLARFLKSLSQSLLLCSLLLLSTCLSPHWRSCSVTLLFSCHTLFQLSVSFSVYSPVSPAEFFLKDETFPGTFLWWLHNLEMCQEQHLTLYWHNTDTVAALSTITWFFLEN